MSGKRIGITPEDIRLWNASRLVFDELRRRPVPKSLRSADADVKKAIRRISRMFDERPSKFLQEFVLDHVIFAHYDHLATGRMKWWTPLPPRARPSSPHHREEPPTELRRSRRAYRQFLRRLDRPQVRKQLSQAYWSFLERKNVNGDVVSVFESPDELDGPEWDGIPRKE